MQSCNRTEVQFEIVQSCSRAVVVSLTLVHANKKNLGKSGWSDLVLFHLNETRTRFGSF